MRHTDMQASELVLYLDPGTSSMAAHIALLECGVSFEARRISLMNNENRSPEFLAINPEGRVPTLLIDGRALTEVAAILFYLARRHPEANLMPASDIEAQAHVISWMSFLASTAHPAMVASRRGDTELQHATAIFAETDRRLGKAEWAVGNVYSIADIHLFRLFWRFSHRHKLSPGLLPNLETHQQRVMTRPAVRRTIEIESAMGYRLR